MSGKIDRRGWVRGALVSGLATALPTGRSVYADDTKGVSGPESGWWTWRGPIGNNIAASAEFSATSIDPNRIVWQSRVPGRGHSSPMVTDDAIYLTTADTASGVQSVLAYRRDDGRPLWARIVHRGGLPRENHRKNTEASPSVAFDGERLLTAFYNSDSIRVTAWSPDGGQVWQQTVGDYSPRQYKYGYAASPAIYRDRAIIVGDYDGPSFLAAISLGTGEIIWKVARPNATSFSSPIVATLGGRPQVLLSGASMIASYDPTDGKMLWRADATTMATCGTLVWDEQHVYASGGYPKAETACVRADGSGKVVWTNSQKCYEQSMLAVGGFVYAVTDQGIAYCWRGTDGEVMWRERLGGDYSSSPILVGDVIHVFNEAGQAFAFSAIPERYEARGTGKIADEVFATPSVVGDTMFLRIAKNEANRRQEYLVAIR